MNNVTELGKKSFEKELIAVLKEMVGQMERMNENLENIDSRLEFIAESPRQSR